MLVVQRVLLIDLRRAAHRRTRHADLSELRSHVRYTIGSSKPVLVVIDEIDGATGDNVSHEHLVIVPSGESPPGARVHQRTKSEGPFYGLRP